MREAISEFIKALNETIERLKAAGYMSPQSAMFNGMGFACRACQWYSYEGRKQSETGAWREYGDCKHPEINSVVEYNGCCNKFTFEGIHT